MNDFTASNGVSVSRQPPVTDRGSWLMVDGHMTSPNDAQALREFFQHERDEDREVWRFSKEPDWVVREIDRDAFGRRRVQCLNERTFEKTESNPVLATGESVKHRAARAYFEAHPERKPLPEIDGIYAVSPNVHPYERLIQRRNGEWIHLRRSAGEFESDKISAESIAQSAVDEGRLTRLVAEDAS